MTTMVSNEAPWIPVFDEQEATSTDNLYRFFKEHPDRRYTVREVMVGVGFATFDEHVRSRVTKRLLSMVRFGMIKKVEDRHRNGYKFYYFWYEP